MNEYYKHQILLEDYNRILKYAQALKGQVKPDFVVADIGAGLGILSYLASSCGARVYSIENNETIHKSKSKLLNNTNHRKGMITHICEDGRKVQLNQKIDIVCSELMGPTGLEEDMINILYHFGANNVVDMFIPSTLGIYVRPVLIPPDSTELKKYKFFENYGIGDYSTKKIVKDFNKSYYSELHYLDWSDKNLIQLGYFKEKSNCDKFLMKEFEIGKEYLKSGFTFSCTVNDSYNALQVFFKARLSGDIDINTDIIESDNNYHWGFYFFLKPPGKTHKAEISYSTHAQKYYIRWK